MRLNMEQAKHLADTSRAVAFAQFAAFGYAAFQEQDYMLAAVSAIVAVLLEVVAVTILEEGEDKR